MELTPSLPGAALGRGRAWPVPPARGAQERIGDRSALLGRPRLHPLEHLGRRLLLRGLRSAALRRPQGPGAKLGPGVGAGPSVRARPRPGVGAGPSIGTRSGPGPDIRTRPGPGVRASPAFRSPEPRARYEAAIVPQELFQRGEHPRGDGAERHGAERPPLPERAADGAPDDVADGAAARGADHIADSAAAGAGAPRPLHGRGSAPPLRPRSRAGPPALTAPRAQIRAQPPRPLIGGGGRNLRARPSRAGERGVTKSRHYQAVLRQAAEGLGDARAPLCGARWFGPPVGGLRGRWAEAGRAEAELRRNGRTQ